MIIDGRKIAGQILATLSEEVKKLSFQPLFCDVLVGNDPVSRSYVNIKGKAAKQIGIKFKLVELPEEISENEILEKIEELNKKPNMCGIIVQLPLPNHITKQAVLNSIDYKLDVDCLSDLATGNYYKNVFSTIPPTVSAILEIFKSTEVDLKNKTILVVGQGKLVGRPLAHILKAQGLKVLVADSSTVNLSELTRNAEVVISATGKPRLITGEMVKAGSVVIDAGTAEENGGIVGDVDFESVFNVASLISPVPGGVGPVTVSKLLENIVMVAKG